MAGARRKYLQLTHLDSDAYDFCLTSAQERVLGDGFWVVVRA
jgi:hypothetical protein